MSTSSQLVKSDLLEMPQSKGVLPTKDYSPSKSVKSDHLPVNTLMGEKLKVRQSVDSLPFGNSQKPSSSDGNMRFAPIAASI